MVEIRVIRVNPRQAFARETRNLKLETE